MKHWTLAAIVICGVIVIALGCGGKTISDPPPCGSSPTAPSCLPTLTLTTSTALLKASATFTFAGTAVHHDGAPTVAISQWSSDNTQVATADASSGKVTALAYGTATIIGEHDGVRATQLLRVVPDFQGTWAGDYAVTGCRATGEFQREGFCTEFAVGTVLPIAATLTQPSDKADGTIYLGELPATVSGTADTGGKLTFTDTTIREDPVLIKLSGMAFTMDGTSRLAGTFTTAWTATGLSGEGGFDARMGTVTRISATAAPLSVRRPLARTWRDLVTALRSR